MAEPKRPDSSKAPGGSRKTGAESPGSDGIEQTVQMQANSTESGFLPPMPFDLTGRTLGEFHLLRRLGRGGMAEVWLAEQTSLRRQVAVKILRPDFVSDPIFVKRFRHEATAAGSLNHPNIVQVYMVGEQEGIHFIAQEYVQGRNLKEMITRKGPLDVPIALHILRQVAAAVQVASSSGIVHRDIKPENVLLNKKGEAKVADFGLAQLTYQGEKVSLTAVGVTMGTPLYMSPEQVNGKTLDVRSDIYSMGVMAFHMLAGHPPFTGDTALAVAVKHMNEAPPKLSDVRPDVPTGVVALIERMLSKKKEDRPADAQSVANELKTLLRQATGKETAPSETVRKSFTSSTSQKKTSFLERPVRQQALWMCISAVIVLACSAGIGWAMRTPDPFLKPVTTMSRVTQFPTTERQIRHAVDNPTEEAWVAVREHPQKTERVIDRADANLALIYLNTRRRSLADKIFNDFVASTDPWRQAHGKAGLAILAGLDGDHANFRKLASQAREKAEQSNSVKKLDPAFDDALQDLFKRSPK